jgi:hypothetical protein
LFVSKPDPDAVRCDAYHAGRSEARAVGDRPPPVAIGHDRPERVATPDDRQHPPGKRSWATGYKRPHDGVNVGGRRTWERCRTQGRKFLPKLGNGEFVT